MNEAPLHGGDVRGIARAHGRDPRDLLDFSANIDPLGPPRAVRRLIRTYPRTGWLRRYPEPGLPDLAAVLARARGVSPDNIVIHGGSAALFDAIFRACRPRRLGLCLPAFAEYARAARANGIDVRGFVLEARAAHPFDPDRFCAWVRDASVDTAVITNPHNPLGFALSARVLLDLRERLPGVTLIVDEAFADYDESLSVAREAAGDRGLIVVRSLTKFYGIPDLRVGYAVMTPERVLATAAYVPAWPVSGIAAAAAAAAVTDTGYAHRTRTRNARCRTMLARGLARYAARVLPSAANFITFEIADAAALAQRLRDDHGIIVRDCSSFDGLARDTYLRVAVRTEKQNALLLRALKKSPGRAPGAGDRQLREIRT